jgi:nucleoside 2-deoxyribosyltransferase
MDNRKSTRHRSSAIFLAAPMSGFSSDAEYRQHRDIVNQACDLIERSGHSVYFAGRSIASQADFTIAGEAFRHDYSHLVDCDFFALYYPVPVRSSVLVEAGMAIGLGKPCLLVAQRTDDLVYLLRQASESSGLLGVPPIEIKEFGTKKPSGIGLATFVLGAVENTKSDTLLVAI